MKILILSLIVLILILTSGCYYLLSEGPYLEMAQRRAEEYITKHPELDGRIKRLILNHNLGIGLTQEQVRLNVNYCRPNEIRDTTKHGANEVWIYTDGNYPVYLYFKKDVLIEIEPQIVKDWHAGRDKKSEAKEQ